MEGRQGVGVIMGEECMDIEGAFNFGTLSSAAFSS